jgi:hypothetical protein
MEQPTARRVVERVEVVGVAHAALAPHFGEPGPLRPGSPVMTPNTVDRLHPRHAGER